MYYDVVYDMTQYAAERHPVGPEWITDHCGGDGTEAYGVFHDSILLRSVVDDIVGSLVVMEDDDDPPPGATAAAAGSGKEASATAEAAAVAANDPSSGAYFSPESSNTGYSGGYGTGAGGGTAMVASTPGGTVDCSTVTTTACVTESELSMHGDSDDLWTAFHGHVYDLTDYRHPAGQAWIDAVAGRDGTDMYDRYHPVRLLKTVDRFRVGVLEGSVLVDLDDPNLANMGGYYSSESSED